MLFCSVYRSRCISLGTRQRDSHVAIAAHGAARGIRSLNDARCRRIRNQLPVMASATRTTSLASSLLEQIAVLILKSRLARYGMVSVEVNASPFGLLQGRVDGVDIRGTDWASPVNLTSRSLYFSLGQTAIDYQCLLTQRRISLLHPKPEGRATILFNSSDFGNFLRHPLFRAASKKAVQSGPFEFDGSSVEIKDGSVLFSGSWNETKFDICLMPSNSSRGQETFVRLTAQGKGSGEYNDLISQELSTFFNILCMDLQGIQLRFNSLDILTQDRDQLLEMKLRATLVEVPPLDVKF